MVIDRRGIRVDKRAINSYNEGMRNANRWKVALWLVPTVDLTPFGEPLARLGFASSTFRWFASFSPTLIGDEGS